MVDEVALNPSYFAERTTTEILSTLVHERFMSGSNSMESLRARVIRCLVSFNSFAEYAPEPNPETKKKVIIWFAFGDDRPSTAFAGIWTEFRGDCGA